MRRHNDAANEDVNDCDYDDRGRGDDVYVTAMVIMKALVMMMKITRTATSMVVSSHWRR